MPKKIYLIIIVLQFIQVLSKAQPVTIQWQKCFGGTGIEFGYCATQTADGGYLLGSLSLSNDGQVSGNHGGGGDYWVARIDSIGNLQWQKCYGGTSQEFFPSIELSSDGGFVISGTTGSNDGDVSGNHGNGDYWVVKCDSAGNIVWQKCFGGTDEERANQIVRTTDNGYLILGFTRSFDFDVVGKHFNPDCTTCQDAWLIKIDSSGNLIWSKCFGGSWSEEGFSIVPSEDSCFYFAAFTNSDDGDVSFGSKGGVDFWLGKIDSSGNLLWENNLGGTYDDTPNDLVATFDGGIIAIGKTESNDMDVLGFHGTNGGPEDVWLTKIDQFGNLQWQKCLGGTEWDSGFRIIQLQDSGFLALCATGSTDGDLINNPPWEVDVWLVKLDHSGNIQWQQCMGGAFIEEAYKVSLTVDGGIIFIGTTNSNNGDVSGNHGYYDSWLVKLAPLPDEIPYVHGSITDFTCRLNLNSQIITVSFYAAKSENVQLNLFDIAGKLVLQKEIHIDEGYSRTAFSASALSKGIYIARLQTEKCILTKKIVAD